MSFRERAQLTFDVAVWEFLRYFKWKDLVIGFVFFTGISGAVFLGGMLVGGSGRVVKVATLGDGADALALPKKSRVQLVAAAGRSEAELRKAVAEGDLDALLLVPRGEAGTLVVRKEPRYRLEIQNLLDESAKRQRLSARGLTPDELKALLAPATLEIVYEGKGGPKSKAVKMTAAIFIIATLMGTILGMAYIFTGITGEKQQRVTEQVIAAIGHQPWIDGKVLGIAAYAMTTMTNLAVGSVLLTVAFWAFSGGSAPFPLAAVPLGAFFLSALFMALALILWNAFFAAIAAIVNDPNTSQKSSAMFLPILPLALALAVLKDPDSLLSRVLAILPFTSPSALPVRYALSTISPFEIVAAVVLMLAAIWMCRRAAGRIFEIGMLMYGKEPTWKEIGRWVRSAPQS